MQYGAALALALAGDAFRAQTLADDLAKRFPEDAVVQFNYLPTIRAQAGTGFEGSTPFSTFASLKRTGLGLEVVSFERIDWWT